jgi:hypothetical protein
MIRRQSLRVGRSTSYGNGIDRRGPTGPCEPDRGKQKNGNEAKSQFPRRDSIGLNQGLANGFGPYRFLAQYRADSLPGVLALGIAKLSIPLGPRIDRFSRAAPVARQRAPSHLAESGRHDCFGRLRDGPRLQIERWW